MDNLPVRKRNRLKEYDYSACGVYHITICSRHKKRLFSVIRENEYTGRADTYLSDIGKIVEDYLIQIPEHYDCISVLNYVIMPNHVHLLLAIESSDDDSGRQVVAPTVSTVVMQFKRNVSIAVGETVWQKGFYDHVIRDESDLENTYVYIDENPVKWDNDEYY